MDLTIQDYKAVGVLEKERVVLLANADLDIGNYCFCEGRSLVGGEGVTNWLGHVFWFPDTPVKSGDYIVIYSCIGEQREFENKSGTKTYVFYLNSQDTVWNTERAHGILMKIEEWEHLPVADEGLEDEVVDTEDVK